MFGPDFMQVPLHRLGLCGNVCKIHLVLIITPFHASPHHRDGAAKDFAPMQTTCPMGYMPLGGKHPEIDVTDFLNGDAFLLERTSAGLQSAPVCCFAQLILQWA